MKRMLTLSYRNKELPPFSCEFGERRRVLDLPLIAWLFTPTPAVASAGAGA